MNFRRVLAALTATCFLLPTAPAQADVPFYEPVSPTGSVLVLTRPVPVGEVVPLPAVAETEVVWTRRTAWLTHGLSATLEGQVVTYDGALPDAEVRLYARPAGERGWRYLASRRTTTDTGAFRFTHRPSRKTSYKVQYVAEWAYTSSQASATVGVKRRITSAVYASSNGTFTMSGSISPRSADKVVRLQRKTCSSCSWSTVTSTTASSTSTYRLRFAGPRSGTWDFRAYTSGDSYYLTSYTGTWSIHAG